MLEDLRNSKEYCGDGQAITELSELLESEVSGSGAADLIKKAIEKEGINQKILAERTGMTRQNVSQMLNRGKNCMRYDNFEKLVAALGYEVVLVKK